jgi:WD40 repeat protein/serine/threonine protein kinase
MPATPVRCPHCRTLHPLDAANPGQHFVCTECHGTFVPGDTGPQDDPSIQLVPLSEPASVPASCRTHPEPPLSVPLPAAGNPLLWQVGDVILDRYEVKQIHEGGMGLVYRVRHRGWNLDLAVKSPRPNAFRHERDKLNFEREAETWVQLGQHPHTVRCCYLRRIDGIPRIFAEYIAGGSLTEWIRRRKLYAGTAAQALERILDVAIQFAWGLAHAHDQGLVHQDVKPANLLLTPAGVAKVTDFGLARARAATDETPAPGARCSLLVTTGGMTPAYCSPEQARREPVSLQTDVWSWAVSVLEMFTGEVTWPRGEVAAEVLESFLAEPPAVAPLPVIPPAVAGLLRHCLQRQPRNRPGSMREIVARLQEIYAAATGRAYPRPAPRPSEDLAASLNNRAVSLLDLGKQAEAEALWEQALAIEAHHPEATYNLGLIQWQDARVSADMLVQRLREVCASHPGEWLPRYLLAVVHLERQDSSAVLTTLHEVQDREATSDEARGLLDDLREQLAYLVQPSRVLEGHAQEVTAVCLAADGSQALSASRDGTLQLWDLSKSAVLRSFQAPGGPVTGAALLGDPSRILAAGNDGALRLWDAASGRCLRTLTGHTEAVTALAVVDKAGLALSGGADQTLRLWDTGSGRCVRCLALDTETVVAVALDADARQALALSVPAARGSGEPVVRLWDLRTGSCRCILPRRGGRVTCVALSRDGRHGLTGHADGMLALWDSGSGQCLRLFAGHSDRVAAVAFSPDGRHAVSGGDEGVLFLWEVATGQCLRRREGHRFGITCVALGADGQQALSGSSDKQVRFWPQLRGHPAAPNILCREHASDRTVTAGKVYQRALDQARRALADSDLLLAAQRIREARAQPGYARHPEALEAWADLYVWLPRKGLAAAWEGQAVMAHRQAVTCVCLALDGSQALSGSKDRTVKLWSVPGGRCLGTLRGHEAAVLAVCLARDGRKALSASSDQTIRVWHLGSGDCLRTLQGHRGAVCSVCVTEDGRFALSGSWDRTVKLWEVATGHCLRTLPAETEITTLALANDEGLVVAGGWDGSLMVWDVASGRSRGPFRGHTGHVRAVCGAPVAGRVLSGGDDKEIHLRDAASGRCLRTLQGHNGPVASVCYSPDGHHAVSAGWDRTVKVWHLPSGQCLRTFEGHEANVHAVCLSADGRHVLSGGDDATVKLWVLDWELGARPAADWDERVRPYLEAFLALHTPRGRALPRYWMTDRDVTRALRRVGQPTWDDGDLQTLLYVLGCAGYGWLRPEMIWRRLQEMARSQAETS